MCKTFLAICALVFCTSTHAVSIITPEKHYTPQEAHEKFQNKRADYEREAREREQKWLNDNLTPEEKAVWNKKGQKWNDVSSPSFCAGYAKTKTEQHPEQSYYKDMYDYFNAKIADGDMMAEPVNNDDFLQGYNLDGDKLIMECVNAFDKVRGFE